MTAPPLPPTSPQPPSGPWASDALEVDRYLDGEGGGEERAARARQIAADPALRARLASRARFLRLLGSSQATLRPATPLEETRLKAALEAAAAPATRAAAWRGRKLLGAAAAVLVAFGAWSGLRGREAQAVLDPAEVAAGLLDWVPARGEGAAGCADAQGPSPFSFPLVQDGELEVRACDQALSTDGAHRALLRRPEELPAVGFVAVPAPGAVPSSEIGITEVGREGVVVFDVLDHGRRVYLAVDAASLRLRHPGRGDTWTCAACHGPAWDPLESTCRHASLSIL